MKLEEIPVQILSLKAGDILVIRYSIETSWDRVAEIHDMVKEAIRQSNLTNSSIALPSDISLAIVGEGK